MADESMIVKSPKLNADENYDFLRTEGLKYIEELGSKLWTDYNEHDPGITILEALCYSITELAYRSRLPMQDLLTDADGKIAASQTLFTAKNILTQSPLTINDYRKLLIDIEGVHNAWFFTDDYYTVNGKIIPAGEVPIYADCKKDALSYDVTPHPVYLSGLYKVLLDLDIDLQFGDLNNGELQVLNPATALIPAGAVSLTVIFPGWDEVIADLLKADPNSITVIAQPIAADGDDWKIAVNFSFMAGGSLFTVTLDGRIIVDLQPAGKKITTSDIVNFFTAAFTQQVLNLYILKIRKSKNIIQTVTRVLHANRNLCEDFINVDTVKDEEIAICCDIDVSPDTDMEAVQAAVFYSIEEYLNPSVKFYLLQEMIDKGYTSDEIFEGPKLQHGFVDTGELEQAQLRKEIYASDIISLVMDIKGVLAARNFRMTKYGSDGKPVINQTGKSWCMPVTLWHKPLFSETKSKIVFYKNQFPYLPGLAEVRDTLRWLHALNARNKLTGDAQDLPVPTGKYYSLESYTSVEYLFPQTYGIGNAGLSPDVSADRKARARQLQAYLLFYDQLLADFFSQVKNAKNIFSTDAIVQTYFGQYIDTIKDIDPLYKKDTSANSLLELLLQNQDSTLVTAGEWQKLYESNETFLDRRNRFLDHLMARFAESFNDYVMLMYSLDYNTQQEIKIDPADLINDKINFLKDYPRIGYERARAFNLFPQNDDFTIDATALWDTDNVSGLEKKACRLAGISNYHRRFLYCIGHADIITTADSPPKFKFVFRLNSSDNLTSVTAFATEDELTSALPAFLDYVLEETNYVVEAAGPKFHILVTDNKGNHLAQSNDFIDEASARDAINKFMIEFNKECDDEGLHLIEHLLLRPRNNLFAFAPVCLDPGCDFCGEQDPYSFRISVVLPYWPAPFKNLAFRNYFETMIRKESPAHTTVKVCWINNASLYEFETAYRNWITALSNYTFNPSTVSALQSANDELVKILFNLHSEYPVATLHDCDESKDTNPVMLGKTILGSFKK